MGPEHVGVQRGSRGRGSCEEDGEGVRTGGRARALVGKGARGPREKRLTNCQPIPLRVKSMSPGRSLNLTMRPCFSLLGKE